MANLNPIKTVDLYESKQKDPNKTLWRSVLAKAIEDSIKMTFYITKNKEFYKDKKFPEIMYVTEPSPDFATVCRYAGFDHKIVRNKMIKFLNKIKENDGKDNLPEMPWKRLYMDRSQDNEQLQED